MKYLISLALLFVSTNVYAQAAGYPRSHNQLSGTGSTSHSTLDTFYNSKGQANGLASLDASGNLVQSAGTVTLPGGYIKQTNGTGTGNILTNATLVTPTISYVQNDNGYFTNIMIASGTGTLSQATIAGVTAPYVSQNNGTGTLSAATIAGVTAPYIAQTNGTGTGVTLAGITDLGTTSINVSGTPLIDLAIGDTDTGIKWNSDGNIDLYINNAYVINLTPSVAKITDTLYIEGGNAHIKIGTTTQDGSAKLTSNGLISVKSGGVKFPDGNTQTEAVTQLVKGITAGSGISIDQSTGTVTITNIGLAAAGGWTDGTNTVYTTVAADQVIIGSTTAASSQILTVVGSTTTNDLNVTNRMSIGYTGTPLIDLAIGDNDTGMEQESDGILSIRANGENFIRIDPTSPTPHEIYLGGSTTTNVLIGTTTSNTKLQVGGTVTASGFSGNGAGLTNLVNTWSGITGNPLDNGSITANATANTIPFRNSSGNVFVAGVVGGTTTGALTIPSGTSAQRPGTPTTGMLRVTSIGTSTGGTISTSGTYTVHTFTSSGTFTAAMSYQLEAYFADGWYAIGTAGGVGTPLSTTVEVLTVAGGGGGGGNGGGGAGGLLYTYTTLSGTNSVIIGAGGASQTNGNNTSCGTITVTGGGAGGINGVNGSNGGSGGGGGGGGTTTGGTGTAGQGNNGGVGIIASPYPAGGGGGAGAVGGAASGSQSGNGGVGLSYNISGASVFYAGGGGGGASNEGAAYGTGGNGGGGAGGTSGGAGGSAGTANTGGGGGGGGRQSGGTGGAGGSGIVIIRYPTP